MYLEKNLSDFYLRRRGRTGTYKPFTSTQTNNVYRVELCPAITVYAARGRKSNYEKKIKTESREQVVQLAFDGQTFWNIKTLAGRGGPCVIKKLHLNEPFPHPLVCDTVYKYKACKMFAGKKTGADFRATFSHARTYTRTWV